MKWFLYILECEDGSFYTGITQNLERRFEDHQSGKGANYTKRKGSVKILYHEIFENEGLAKNREKQIKKWSGAKKKALINKNFIGLRALSVSRD